MKGLQAAVQLGRALPGGGRPGGSTLQPRLQCRRAGLGLLRPRVQRRRTVRQSGGLGLKLGKAAVQFGEFVVHLGGSGGKGVAARLGAVHAGGQVLNAFAQLARPLGQRRGRVAQLPGALGQLARALFQFGRALGRRVHTGSVLGKALGELGAAISEGEGAVRQEFQVIPDGLAALGQIGCALFQFCRAVGPFLQPVADVRQLFQHGLGVGLGHALPHFGLDFGHGALAQLGGDVVGAGVGLIAQLHGLGRRVGDGGRVGGKVLWDGDDHVIGPVRKALLGIVRVHKMKIEGAVLPQVVGQLAADGQRLAVVFHRLVLVHHRHRQTVHTAVGVPHGPEKQRGVDGGDGHHGHHHHQHDPVAPQSFPFVFQHDLKFRTLSCAVSRKATRR